MATTTSFNGAMKVAYIKPIQQAMQRDLRSHHSAVIDHHTLSAVIERGLKDYVLKRYGLSFMQSDGNVLNWNSPRDGYGFVLYEPPRMRGWVSENDTLPPPQETKYARGWISAHAVMSLSDSSLMAHIRQQIDDCAKEYWTDRWGIDTAATFPGHDECIQARHLAYRLAHPDAVR